MLREEFLQKLKDALANDLSMPMIQDNIDYYNNYIIEEVQKGRNEEGVIDELGDPWAIARTLIDSAQGQEPSSQESAYNPDPSYNRGQNEERKVHVFGLDSWWKKVLLILGIAGIVFLVIAVISGIFSLLMPVILPFLVVLLIIRMFRGRR